MPQITKQILGGVLTPGPEFDDIIAAAKSGKLIQWWDPYAKGGAAWVDGYRLGLTDARKNYRVKPASKVPVIKTGVKPKITRHEAPVVTPPPTFTLNLSEAELAFVAGVTGRIAGQTQGVRGISDGLWKEAMHALGIHQTSGLLNAKAGLWDCLYISTTVAELTENLRALQAQAKLTENLRALQAQAK